MKQILDQINALQPGGSPLSPLKALTQQLKRGRTGTSDPPSPELPARVEDEVEELQELYRKRPEEEEVSMQVRSEEQEAVLTPAGRKRCKSFLSCQELGNSFLQTVNTVSGSALNLQSVVQETLERLGRTEQEVNEMRSQRIIQIQEQRDYCRKYRERLDKTLQDLHCVSEMLDSCTLMDLGSDLQTSKLLERFSQARPHFTQLDAEVEFMLKSWETLRGVQERESEEEDPSERVHPGPDQQLPPHIQTAGGVDPDLTGSCGSSEEQQQIQSLFKTASTLKSDICTSVSSTGWTRFHGDQLEARLVSLDSLRASWLKAASRREEKPRERLLSDDINQLPYQPLALESSLLPWSPASCPGVQPPALESSLLPWSPASCPGVQPPALESSLLPWSPASCPGVQPPALESSLLPWSPASCPGVQPLALESSLLPWSPASCPGVQPPALESSLLP
ncbi:hypothetical protein KUCAC02_033200, partial [Chaenocephalus aceratus]